MKTYCALILISLALAPLTCVAKGATLSFEVVSPVSSTTPLRIAVLLASSVSLNALEATIALPPGVTLVDISQDNSLVSYWIEKPHMTGAGLSFAGLIPAGWSGEGEVFEMLLSNPQASEDFSLASARAFLNSPDATEVSLSLSNSALSPRGAWYAYPWAYILIAVLAGLFLLLRRARLRFI